MFVLEKEKSRRMEKDLKRIIAAEVHRLTDIEDEARSRLLPLLNAKVADRICQRRLSTKERATMSHLSRDEEMSWERNSRFLGGMTLEQRMKTVQEMQGNGVAPMTLERFDSMVRRMIRDRRISDAAERSLSEEEWALWSLRREVESENKAVELLRKLFKT